MDNSTAKLHFKSLTYTSPKKGPRAIILGAVHGNETCGTTAIQRVIAEIDAQQLHIVAGSVTLVPITNPLAYARGERMGDRNLNRNLAPTLHPKDFEDHIGNWLCPLLAQHEVLLDLHSTRAYNAAFAMLGPENNCGDLQPFVHAEKEWALAQRLGVRRFVDGWLDTYAKGVENRLRYTAANGLTADPLNTDSRYGVGTTEYMRAVGGYAITLECGQHDDPAAPEIGYRAIRNTLAYLGLADLPVPAPVDTFESLSMIGVIDKIHTEDTFSREWSSFDRLSKGDLIGTRYDGTPVVAEEDGFILFPDAKAQPAHEWFYLARENT